MVRQHEAQVNKFLKTIPFENKAYSDWFEFHGFEPLTLELMGSWLKRNPHESLPDEGFALALRAMLTYKEALKAEAEYRKRPMLPHLVIAEQQKADRIHSERIDSTLRAHRAALWMGMCVASSPSLN